MHSDRRLLALSSNIHLLCVTKMLSYDSYLYTVRRKSLLSRVQDCIDSVCFLPSTFSTSNVFLVPFTFVHPRGGKGTPSL